MADRHFTARGADVFLFDEDFDLPAQPYVGPEPEVIEPLFTFAELQAAREEVAHESREAALGEAHASTTAAAGQALTAIAGQLVAARAGADAVAEQSADAIARLLLACFAAAFPALSARHGAAETAALLREILPALRHEPMIVIRVSPHVAPEMIKEIQEFDADLAAHVQVVPTDALPIGDAQVNWHNGAARRDAASLWRQIEQILAPAGLLRAEVSQPDRTVPDRTVPDRTVKEPARVE
jgi:flagellar biosynthesis/type III secretory pathway protein FliH